MPTVGVAGRVWDGTPGQGHELGMQVGLIAFNRQDPVGAAFGEVGDVITLAVHGVGGDHGVAQVADLIEQRLEPGDVGTSETLAAEFVGTPWYRNVIEQPLPPSISSDAGQFRRSSFYEQYVQPAGHRDGVTGALRRGGRYVGLVHLASASAGVFDTDTRQLLAAMLPALAALADLTERIRGLGNLPAEASAALVGPDGIVDLPDRDRPPMLADDEFLVLLAEFAGSGGGSLMMVWRVGRDWYRVGLSRQPPAGWPGVDVLLVQARVTRLPYGLSPRELDVLTRIAMGQSNQAIAHGLFVSPRTVHTHIEHILRKTGCFARAEAAALAMREHLLRPTPGGALAWFVPERHP